MVNHSFHFSQAELIDLVKQLIAKALKGGATACEAEISEGNGWTVSVRLGDIETLEYHQDKSITINVYFDKNVAKPAVPILLPKHWIEQYKQH